MSFFVYGGLKNAIIYTWGLENLPFFVYVGLENAIFCIWGKIILYRGSNFGYFSLGVKTLAIFA